MIREFYILLLPSCTCWELLKYLAQTVMSGPNFGWTVARQTPDALPEILDT
jgi:hypothetical protein